ncbi:MAG: hypothetical protein R2865_08300 [Deinococcales bacterium]
MVSPDEPVAAVGSGGAYAEAAARALLQNTDLSAEEIVRKALTIAADIDIYTSGQMTVFTVGEAKEAQGADSEEADDETDDRADDKTDDKTDESAEAVSEDKGDEDSCLT